MQDAGITTNMTVEEISSRIAKQVTIRNKKDEVNSMIADGYEAVPAGTTGAIPIQHSDGSTSYFRQIATGGGGYAPSQYTKEWNEAGGGVGTGMTLGEWIMNRTGTGGGAIDLTSLQIRQELSKAGIATREDAQEYLDVGRASLTPETIARAEAVINSDYPNTTQAPTGSSFLDRLFGTTLTEWATGRPKQ